MHQDTRTHIQEGGDDKSGVEAGVGGGGRVGVGRKGVTLRQLAESLATGSTEPHQIGGDKLCVCVCAACIMTVVRCTDPTTHTTPPSPGWFQHTVGDCDIHSTASKREEKAQPQSSTASVSLFSSLLLGLPAFGSCSDRWGERFGWWPSYDGMARWGGWMR